MNWMLSTEYLLPPFGHLGNCPKNLALIQIFLARMTLQKKYSLKDPVAIVIHVCNKGVDVHTLPSCLLVMENLYYKKLTTFPKVKKPPAKTPKKRKKASPNTKQIKKKIRSYRYRSK